MLNLFFRLLRESGSHRSNYGTILAAILYQIYRGSDRSAAEPYLLSGASDPDRASYRHDRNGHEKGPAKRRDRLQPARSEDLRDNHALS